MEDRKAGGPASCLACIDVTGGERALDAVAIRPSGDVCHQRCGSIDTLRRWLRDVQPHVVAVDAPSSNNKRLTRDPAIRAQNAWRADKHWNQRVAEALLSSRQIGLYGTPARGEGTIQSWISTGRCIYAMLLREGYGIWRSPGLTSPDPSRRWAIEVHPNACFVSGLGFRPPNKETIAGVLLRVAYLNGQAHALGWIVSGESWPGGSWLSQLSNAATLISALTATSDNRSVLPEAVAPLVPVGHDVIDCFAGIITSARFLSGQAEAVGHERESVIVIPEPLPATSYPSWREMVAASESRHRLAIGAAGKRA